MTICHRVSCLYFIMLVAEPLNCGRQGDTGSRGQLATFSDRVNRDSPQLFGRVVQNLAVGKPIIGYRFCNKKKMSFITNS